MSTKSVKAKLPKSVKRITILKSAGAGAEVERVEVRQKKKRKKQSKGLRIWERIVRGAAKSSQRTADNYLVRHRRANRKKRDGWFRDLSYNAMKARRKGSKSFNLSKLLST
jgi:hypothetical protein